MSVLVTSQDTSECEVSADGGATYGVSGTVAMVPTGGDASAAAASLWNSPHTVTVRGKDDDVNDGNQICRVTVDPSETGASNLPYNRLSTQTVSATNEDDDVAGLTVSAVMGQATEAGGTATFTVKLATRADGGGDGDGDGRGRERGHGVAVVADLRAGRLGHGADGDGDRRRRRRRRRRRDLERRLESRQRAGGRPPTTAARSPSPTPTSG